MGGCTPPESRVTARTWRPVPSPRYTCGVPLRPEMKAIRPSARKRGVSSPPGPAISGRGRLEPSAATTQMSAFRLPVTGSVVVRTKTTRRPSGDTWGSPTRIAVIRSAIVMGRLPGAWATAKAEVPARSERPAAGYRSGVIAVVTDEVGPKVIPARRTRWLLVSVVTLTAAVFGPDPQPGALMR